MENNNYKESNFEYIIGNTKFVVNLFFEKGTKNTFENKMEKAAKIDIQCDFEDDENDVKPNFSNPILA